VESIRLSNKEKQKLGEEITRRKIYQVMQFLSRMLTGVSDAGIISSGAYQILDTVSVAGQVLF
jgi:ABC-type bacteriocin/lantibiotic exporter with double-glycine peptidase domain